MDNLKERFMNRIKSNFMYVNTRGKGSNKGSLKILIIINNILQKIFDLFLSIEIAKQLALRRDLFAGNWYLSIIWY